MRTFSGLLLVIFFLSTQALNAQTILTPKDTLIARNYQTELYNYIPDLLSTPIGDVNGDGKLDFNLNYISNNPYTDYLGDYSYITGISYYDEHITSDHDVVANYRLIPAGDLNGDGFDDFIAHTLEYQSSGAVTNYFFAFNNKEESVIGDEIIPAGEVQGRDKDRIIDPDFKNIDLNGDGFEDMLTFQKNTSEFGVLFGDSKIDSLSEVSYSNVISTRLENEFLKFSELIVGDTDNNGTLEVVVIGGYQSPGFGGVIFGDNYDLMVKSYQIGKDKSLTQIDSTTISIDKYFNSTGEAIWGFGPTKTESWFTDIDQDGNMELLISGYYSLTGVAIYLDSDSANSIFNKAEWLLSETPLTEGDERLLGYLELKMIGDYNGDGKDDLYWSSGNERVYLSSVNDDTLLVNNTNLVEETGGTDYQFDFFGDINHDGFDDIRMNIEGGFRYYLGNEDMTFSEYFDLTRNSSKYEPQYDALFLIELGDLDSDGIDDIGIVKDGEGRNDITIRFPRTGYKQNDWIEIYLSGSGDLDSNNPSIIIEDTSFVTMDPPITGDFNGDGNIDLAVNYSTNFRKVGGGIYIYFGDSGTIDNEPDHILDFNELIPGYEEHLGFPFLENIGDLNNDGIDDLIFATPHSDLPISKSYVLLGNQNLSNTWDFEIPFWGSDFENTGDLNGDGINNIAIANHTYGNHPFDVYYKNDFSTGQVKIYSSFNEKAGETFDTTAVMELGFPKVTEPNEQLGGFGRFISSGDLNGDGIRELIVQAEKHNNYMTGEALELIFVYSGGENLDSIPDAAYKVPYQYFQNLVTSEQSTTDEFFSSGLGNVTVIKDLNEDGKDELLIESSFITYTKNAILYTGGDLNTIFEQEPYVFYAPNQFTEFGTGDHYSTKGSYDHLPHFEPVYGNFSGTDVNSFLFFQNGEKEFVSPPVYKYDLFKVPVNTETNETPSGFTLDQNYPNPFNPTTNITYTLDNISEVTLEIFNILGQKVQTLVNERKNPGTYRVTFDARNLSSGMYFYKLSTSGFTQTKKMVLIK